MDEELVEITIISNRGEKEIERKFRRVSAYVWIENGLRVAVKTAQLLEKRHLGIKIEDKEILELL